MTGKKNTALAGASFVVIDFPIAVYYLYLLRKPPKINSTAWQGTFALASAKPSACQLLFPHGGDQPNGGRDLCNGEKNITLRVKEAVVQRKLRAAQGYGCPAIQIPLSRFPLSLRHAHTCAQVSSP